MFLSSSPENGLPRAENSLQILRRVTGIMLRTSTESRAKMHSENHTPTEIRLNPAKDELKVTFNDGKAFSFTAEFLRVLSPSAEVQGHGPDEKKTVGGKKTVTITHISATGNYAIRPVFSDGHSTGIYSWSYLYELGENQDKLWQAYLGELERKGMSREK
jgi:DUF971 family protein